MKNFKEIIKSIEDHSGEPFDFNNRRMIFRLQSKVDRLIAEKDSIINRIKNVLDGDHTFDPKSHKSIRLKQ